MKQYILALDAGTTSARSILFDKNRAVISVAQHEIPQIFPQAGWVEQNPMDIYASQYSSLTECIAKSGVSPDEIAGIGVTNQRETALIWEKSTGKPIYNAIVWQCRRTAGMCEQLSREGYGEMIAKATGLRLDAYFSATKISWILDHVPGARKKAERGELLFGTVDTWLLWKLSGGSIFVTDRTNASRTMLYNIHTLTWDRALCDLFGIPMNMLPEVRSSSEIYGEISVMGSAVPVSGIAGDQQAALFGQGCFSEGDMKITYGTGCFLLAHTGKTPVRSAHGMLTTIAATAANQPVEYALEGSVFVGGAVVQWLRDGLRFISDAKDTDYFAQKVKSSCGVYVVPAFAGLGAPYWDMRARGIITGLTRGTGREHIIRAALESIAYQSDDVIQAMQSDFGGAITSLRADGGASANNFLMQFQADISDTTVIRPSQKEATAAGAAFLAGLATGFWTDREELKANEATNATFRPSMDGKERKKLLEGWHEAVRACTGRENLT